MSEQFIPIKVDREERPDLDQIYMNAVQLMTGRGGWPMSVFLTPDLKPFYGGASLAPTAPPTLARFVPVLISVAAAWGPRRDKAIEQAESLLAHLEAAAAPPPGEGDLGLALLDQAVAALERTFDHTYGGFGGAPKFPHPMDLRLLLHAWRRRPDTQWLHM